ncbi:hypothetical protein J2Z31_004784 [Sinorhizobium kostiense]|uniref:Transposase n=1 Tax=Sinorhizobium kostiense TaxID=76747 RepID=A0ABS4R5T2_9HYPH|nr:hypothetical protein [Sinorhizobium kostiense]
MSTWLASVLAESFQGGTEQRPAVADVGIFARFAVKPAAAGTCSAR